VQAKAQYHGEPLTSRLEIDVTLFFGRKGKKDWDNFHKLSMDALTGIVWEDDEQIDDAHVHKRYDKENPRIEITGAKSESLEKLLMKGVAFVRIVEV
jgi:Holliday junction resolvase RusA-like endonuclease